MPAKGYRKPNRWSEEHRGYDTPCWIWQLSRMATGYGCIGIREGGTRRTVYAHRFHYEQAKGPIPEGLYIDHLCGNRACVNPAHLEAVSPRENVRRSSLTKLTQEQVDEIREAALAGNELRKDIAARYDITPTHVAFIANGKTWRDGARRKVKTSNLA